MNKDTICSWKKYNVSIPICQKCDGYDKDCQQGIYSQVPKENPNPNSNLGLISLINLEEFKQ